MINADLINKFDSKIVNNKGMCDWFGFMVPQTRGVGAFEISTWCKFAEEAFVCKDACLR
jgi:hypothetical protein